MAKGATPTWLRSILVFVGLLVAIPGLWLCLRLNAPVIHPHPQNVPSVTNAAPSPTSINAVEQARQMIQARISQENLPGLSVAVGSNGEVVWAEGFGYADLKSSLPVTPSDRFRIGTVSTALTSAAAGLLIEAERLKIEDEIQTYLPAFPRKQWPVKVRDLMRDTAGISAEGGDDRPLFTKHCSGPMEALPHFAAAPLLFQPGTEYRYSTYGWILMSAAVEAAARQPFLTFMRERIFEPLGMRDTVADASTVENDDDFPLVNLVLEQFFDPRTRRPTKPDARKSMNEGVTTYSPTFRSDPTYGMHVTRPLDLSCYAGSSVFVSTPSDLVRFGMAINGGKLLQPATVQLIQTSQTLLSGQPTGYGLGWQLDTVVLAGKQTRVAGYNGELMGGPVASLITLPDHGIVVSVMSNISHTDTFSFAAKIAELFANHGTSK